MIPEHVHKELRRMYPNITTSKRYLDLLKADWMIEYNGKLYGAFTFEQAIRFKPIAKLIPLKKPNGAKLTEMFKKLQEVS